ncbi:MAG: AAA family ATPase [Candidatus Lokiarchaeota archaeon]|nr:AAA family ATPase [Candidatus Lokiarchaeota archaeon]
MTLIQSHFVDNLEDLLIKCKIVSIFGPSGSGKTTLAMQIVASLLDQQGKSEPSCVWVQASERFSRNRFETMIKASKPKACSLLSRIFVLPGSLQCRNLLEQQVTLEKVSSPSTMLPPDLKIVVIDNISHHLRYAVSNGKDAFASMKIMNEFFDFQLLPIIMTCQREGIALLLVHEISYVPELDTDRPFFHKLYDRIECINIQLTIDNENAKKLLLMTYNAQKFETHYYYRICDAGIHCRLLI